MLVFRYIIELWERDVNAVDTLNRITARFGPSHGFTLKAIISMRDHWDDTKAFTSAQKEER